MKDLHFHPAPEWLTKDYLQSVLQRYKKDDGLTILDLTIKPATSKGENYASVMTRVEVELRLSDTSEVSREFYIVKTTYENDPFISNIMNPYDIYRTEMLMYEKVLPQLSEILRETGDQDKLFADTVYVDYEHSAIIFEDLAVSNFVLADRLVGMDMEHAKLALKKLAKMHATAAVYNERSPGLLDKLDHGIFNRHTKGFAPFFENMIEVSANYSADCPELGEYYKEKLLKLKAHVVENATRVGDLYEGHFHTLCHGDFWINNVMLSYNCKNGSDRTRTIKDIKIIDFQFSAWASPSIDLHYFLNTSLQPDIQLNQQDELIQHYHYVLCKTLRQLKFNGFIPSLHDFWIQLERGRFYAVTSTLVVQPVMINGDTDDADFHSLVGENERAHKFRRRLYTNKVVQENVKRLLPLFDRRGLLDLTP